MVIELGTVKTGIGLIGTVWEWLQKLLPTKVFVSANTYGSAGADALVVEMGLVFSHNGHKPVVIESLRIMIPGERERRPLVYTAVVPNIGGLLQGQPHPPRDWARPIVVEPGKVTNLIVQFLRNPGRLTQADNVPAELEILLAGRSKWKVLRRFALTVRPQFAVHSVFGLPAK